MISDFEKSLAGTDEPIVHHFEPIEVKKLKIDFQTQLNLDDLEKQFKSIPIEFNEPEEEDKIIEYVIVPKFKKNNRRYIS